MIKDALSEIVGRRITGVILRKVRDPGRGTRSQVLLFFEGETHFELYSPAPIQAAGGTDKGGGVELCEPTRDLAVIYGAFEDPALQYRAAMGIMVSKLVDDILGGPRGQLVDSLRTAADLGFDWSSLYGRAAQISSGSGALVPARADLEEAVNRLGRKADD